MDMGFQSKRILIELNSYGKVKEESIFCTFVGFFLAGSVLVSQFRLWFYFNSLIKLKDCKTIVVLQINNGDTSYNLEQALIDLCSPYGMLLT